MSRIEALLNEFKLAKSALAGELLRLWPAGTEVRFTIMHGQRNASTGTVCSAGWHEGYLRVKHHEAKPNSRYAYREVHYSDMLP
jgi:hypothetical protein